ncbi:GNAT family N-acetyltransferase [Streptomyces hoynatensis]|uniref:GNAT family N-acetyltransferase n=1 Tax=Streptomyces hoynatensis TaxID=1141874 RepID=A0A3A9Z0I7_9ACTN|nr:GNAT family N-acetyltransferase [Streptomyces hoynatensis]RKN40887.1 GNAT family N-acetyltransferase [Streptomyces hoynatensis]
MFIEERAPDDPGLAGLLEAAMAELVARYGPNRTPVRPGARYLVAVADGRPAACGAVQPTEEPGTGEVKRMYVAPWARRRGLARSLLKELERLAADELGLRRVRLATGVLQPEAIALYDTSGYLRTPPFGRYAAEGHALCYAKELAAQAA